MMITTTRVSKENARASHLAMALRACRSASALSAGRPGIRAMTIAPARGTAPATVSQGKPFIYSLTTRSNRTRTAAPRNMDRAYERTKPV